MSRGVNKVILLGHCGQDPETHNTSGGGQVTKVSLATSEKWKDKQGHQQEHTEWHRLTFFGKLAEIVAQYVKKGSKIYVEGKNKTNKWQDRDGNDRWTTEVVCHEMQMLDGRGGEDRSDSQPQSPSNEQSSRADLDDDIPF